MSLAKENAIKLRESKMKIPIIGFDATLENLFSEKSESEIKAAISTAIDAGYRLILCNPFFTQSEIAVGKTVRKKMEEMQIDRKEFFIVTLVFLNLPEQPGFVEKSVKKSLENLDLQYIDLLLLSCQVFGDRPYVDYTGSWLGMESCYKKKWVKSLGTVNFTQYKIGNILKMATVKPSVNMIHCSVLSNCKTMRDFLKKHKIVAMSKTTYGAVSIKPVDPRKESPEKVHLKEVVPLKQLAAKYNKTICQMAIRYLIEIGVVPIVKTGRDKSILENIDVFDFKIDEEDMRILTAIDDGNYDPNLKLYNTYPEDYARLGLSRLKF